MAPRTLATVALVALASGCASARPVIAPARPQSAVPRAAEPADPDRWARAACLRGEYPLDLGEGAYTQARQRDLQAERAGQPVPGATMLLLQQRVIFQNRCVGWLQRAETAPGTPGDSPYVSALWTRGP